MLNMAYDVPVKLLAFHLILMALVVLAPDLPRLGSFFLLNRSSRPSTEPPLFRTPRANRIALAATVIFGLWLLGMNAYQSRNLWNTYGGGSPKSPLYGVWDVDQMTVDGQIRAPLLTDSGRWRRVVFDVPTRITFQRMDDSFARYGSAINTGDKTLGLTKDGDAKWKATYTFERPAPDHLTLDGEMDGQKIQMQLKLIDRDKFLLLSTGFHWIQEYPVNR